MNPGKILVGGIRNLGKFVGTHRSEIMLGLGIASGITTIGLGIRAGRRVQQEIDDNKDNISEMYDAYVGDDPSPANLLRLRMAVFAKTWKYYVPPVLSGTASILCFTGAYSIRVKDNAKLASACMAAETLVTQYQDQFVEPRNAQERKRNSEVDEQFLDEAARRYDTAEGEGDCVFFDAVTGMTFRSTQHAIELAKAALITDLSQGVEYVTIGDLYNNLPGVKAHHLGEMLEHFGWIKDGVLPNIAYTARFEDGKPVGVIHYQAMNLTRLDETLADIS